MTYLDEVHAVGMYGPRGGGVAERDGVDAPRRRDRRHARQGVRLARRLYRGQRRDRATRCAPMRRASSSPPRCRRRSAPRRRASIRHLKTSRWERDRHQERVARVKAVLTAAGLPVMPTATHIVPIMVGDPEKCKAASDMLLAEHGIYIQPINYPTVPKGTERLRVTPSPYHDDEMIDALAEALVDVWERLGLPLKRAARGGIVNPIVGRPRAARVRACCRAWGLRRAGAPARHRQRYQHEARQMMRPDKHRIEMQRQRQHHHGVESAGRERHDDIGRPQIQGRRNRKRKDHRYRNHKHEHAERRADVARQQPQAVLAKRDPMTRRGRT